ncbi:LysM peptidoglycan-binding domain-containing protein [Bacteroidota bacterium]
MNCPVCQANIQEDIKLCPSCNSDLEAFGHTKKLSKRLKNQMLGIVLLSVLFIVVAIAWVITILQKGNKQELEEWKNEAMKLEIEKSELTNKMSDLNKQIEELKAREKSDLKMKGPAGLGESSIYVVKKGDNLWNIAKLKFGDPLMYKKIAQKNEIENPDFIIIGQKLNLKE